MDEESGDVGARAREINSYAQHWVRTRQIGDKITTDTLGEIWLCLPYID